MMFLHISVYLYMYTCSYIMGIQHYARLWFSALSLNLTAWFSSRDLLPVTHLLYPTALMSCHIPVYSSQRDSLSKHTGSLGTTRNPCHMLYNIREGATLFPGLLHFILNTYLSYGMTWDWNLVYWAISKHFLCIYISKLADRCRRWPEGSLFNSYYIEV